MKNPPNPLTEVARDAYLSGLPSPYLSTSDNDMSHRIGLWLHRNGFSVPSLVHASRGYSYKVVAAGLTLTLSFAKSSTMPERLA